MKKYRKSILISLMVLASVLILCSCGGTTLNGAYYRDVNDTRFYTFNEDGTCSLNDNGEVFKGTYTRDGKNITIDLEGGNAARSGKISGKTLTLDEFGYENKYKKK